MCYLGLRLDRLIRELCEMVCTLGVWIQTIVGGVMLFSSGSGLLNYLLASNNLILQVLGKIAPRGVDLIYSMGTLRVVRVLEVVKQCKTLLLLSLASTRVVRLLILANLNSCQVLRGV